VFREYIKYISQYTDQSGHLLVDCDYAVNSIHKKTEVQKMPRKEKVTKVIDGDTFMTDKRKNPVRLANVDTPEKRQPGYQDAKKELEKLVVGQVVSIDTVARDKYGRSIAKVKVGTRSVNKAMEKHKKK